MPDLMMVRGNPEAPKIGDQIRFFIPITRVDKAKRMVYGWGVTDKEPQSGRVRITKEAMEEALPEWMQYRNIREMHEKKSVGKGKQIELGTTEDGHNGIFIGSFCHEDSTWAKIDGEDPLLIGYSIGAYIKKLSGHDVTRMRINEFSYVDNPDIDNCKFTEILCRGESLAALAPEGTMREKIVKMVELFKAGFNGLVEEGKGLERSAENSIIKRSLWLAGDMIRALQGMGHLKTAALMEASEGKTDPQVAAALGEVVTIMNRATMIAVAAEVGEGAPGAGAAAESPEAVVAASVDAGELKRASAKLSKATKSKVAEMHRLSSTLLGLKALTDDEIETQRAENDKAETDAAAKTAADEKEAAKAAAAADKAGEGAGKGTPAEAPAAAPAAAAAASGGDQDLVRNLEKQVADGKTALAAMETRLKAMEGKVQDPKALARGANPGGPADPPGAEPGSAAKLEEEYRTAVLGSDAYAVTSLQLRGFRPSRELDYSLHKEIQRRTVPGAASQGGN